MRTVICESELNEVMNCKKSVKSDIVPGMGATMFVGTDRYAMVVVKVLSPKKIKVTYADELKNKFVTDENGIDMMPAEYMEEFNNYEDYSPMAGNSHGLLHTYTLRKNGRWMPEGKNMWETCSIHVGKAEDYRDLNF